MASPLPPRDAACVALIHDGAALVARTVRYPDVWQPLGGGIEPGERPEDAAVRETREEAGVHLSADDLIHIGRQQLDVRPGTVTFFRANVPTPDVHIDHAEIVEHRWVPVTELAALPAYPASKAFFEHLAASVQSSGTWHMCPVCSQSYPQTGNPQGCPNQWRFIGGAWVERPADRHEAAASAVHRARRTR